MWACTYVGMHETPTRQRTVCEIMIKSERVSKQDCTHEYTHIHTLHTHIPVLVRSHPMISGLAPGAIFVSFCK